METHRSGPVCTAWRTSSQFLGERLPANKKFPPDYDPRGLIEPFPAHRARYPAISGISTGFSIPSLQPSREAITREVSKFIGNN